MNLFEEKLLNLFGSYKDFPKPGIVFCDILPVLRDRDIFAELIESMVKSDSLSNSDAIVAIDARGFILEQQLLSKQKTTYLCKETW